MIQHARTSNRPFPLAQSIPPPPLFTEFISSHDAGVYARPDARNCLHIGAVGRSIEEFEDAMKAISTPFSRKA